MKKAMKQLAGIWAIILCCALLFPLTAMAEGAADVPEGYMNPNDVWDRVSRDAYTWNRVEEYYVVPHEVYISYIEAYLRRVDDISFYPISGEPLVIKKGELIPEYRLNISYGPIEGIDSTGSTVTAGVSGEYVMKNITLDTELETSRIQYNVGGVFTATYGIGSINTTSVELAEGPHNTTNPSDIYTADIRGDKSLTTLRFKGDNATGGREDIRVDFRVVGVKLHNENSSLADGIKDDKEESKAMETIGGMASDNTDLADPLTTLAISLLAILLSILFGNTGGFIPSVPAGAGGTSSPSPADVGFSRWLHYDSDGDIEATDPVNGQKRTFVHNGDGSYTDPISGATYTPEELSEQMEHRADNAGTIGQDEAQFRQNVDEDSKRNQERSNESQQLEEDLQRERQERVRRDKVERVATELGMSGASEDEVRRELARRMERDEDFRQKMNDYAQRQDTAVDILETTVDAVDYGMAIGEVVVPGGKTVSATYKGIKNIGETVMEKGASVGSVVEGVIKGGTEAATTVMDSSIGKAVTTIGGTVAGEIAEAVNNGEDITRATAEGLIKGAGNATIGAISDAVGDVVNGGKASEVAVKIVETGFSKEVAEPLYDESFHKDK